MSSIGPDFEDVATDFDDMDDEYDINNIKEENMNITNDESNLNNMTIDNDLKNENQPTQVKKIEVDNKKLQNTPYDNVIEAKQWTGLPENRHMGLVGASTTGKTHLFKTFLADQKIKLSDIYITVADLPGKSEIITGFCTLQYLTEGSYKNKKYLHYTPDEIEKAIAYCLADENINYSKTIFLSDCLLASQKTKTSVANFINKAKNFKCTVIVEIHNLVGDNMVMMRNALAVIVYLDQPAKTLARLLDASIDDNMIRKYSGFSKFDKVIIVDKLQGNFNKHYLPF